MGMPSPRTLFRHAPVRAGAALAVLALTAAACGGSGSGKSPTTAQGGSSTATSGTSAATTLTAAEASYRLSAPISREVVLADGSSLVILGGLDRAQQSAAGVYRLDTAAGGLTHLGNLASSVHDAAGAVLGGRDFV